MCLTPCSVLRGIKVHFWIMFCHVSGGALQHLLQGPFDRLQNALKPQVASRNPTRWSS